jgi:hypothetical protein
MKKEGYRYSLWLDDRATVEERANAAHELFRALVDPPRCNDELRTVALKTAMHHLCEGSPSRRAKTLDGLLRAYLGCGWLRERDLAELPRPCSTQRLLLHRIAKLNDGRPISWRQILRICGR